MFKKIFITILFMSTPAMAIEYDLPESFHRELKDSRHLLKAHCSLFYESTFIQRHHSASSGLGGGSGKTTITTSSGMSPYGNGVVYGEDTNYYYVITCGHLIIGNPISNPYVEFNHHGQRSPRVIAHVLYKRYTPNTYDDFALLRINKQDLNHYPVKPVPLADPGEMTPLNKWMVLLRSGSINYAQITQADYYSFLLNTKIQKGVSGSPITDMGATKLYGIVLRTDGHCLSYHHIADYIRDYNRGVR